MKPKKKRKGMKYDMPCICYVEKNFQNKSLDLIGKMRDIITDFIHMGYELTLRQVYYQLVAAALIPNTERSYKNIGELLNDARLAGLIDWNSVTDRTRNLSKMAFWDSPASILGAATEQYKKDYWEYQPNYIEVWVEKDALKDIVGKACNKYRVPYFSCRGYVSQSEMWAAAQRIGGKDSYFDLERDMLDEREDKVIIHVGDHDPSGIDMSRDIQDRLNLFEANVTVVRVALNLDQIQQYAPPPNPAKVTDSRAKGYIRQFGHSSWELDALHPRVLTEVIQNSITEYMDLDIMERVFTTETEEKEKMAKVIYEKFGQVTEEVEES